MEQPKYNSLNNNSIKFTTSLFDAHIKKSISLFSLSVQLLDIAKTECVYIM